MNSWQSLSSVMIGFGIILLIPGPANILLLVSGLTKGFLKSTYLIIAEAGGYIAAIALWGFLLSSLSVKHPLLPTIIKILCSLYIFYLAVKIWSYGKSLQVSQGVAFHQLLLASSINPKAILLSGFFLPLGAFDSMYSFLYPTFILLTVMIPAGLLWIFMGELMKHYSSAVYLPLLYRLASFILIGFGCFLFFSGLK